MQKKQPTTATTTKNFKKDKSAPYQNKKFDAKKGTTTGGKHNNDWKFKSRNNQQEGPAKKKNKHVPQTGSPSNAAPKGKPRANAAATTNAAAKKAEPEPEPEPKQIAFEGEDFSNDEELGFDEEIEEGLRMFSHDRQSQLQEMCAVVCQGKTEEAMQRAKALAERTGLFLIDKTALNISSGRNQDNKNKNNNSSKVNKRGSQSAAPTPAASKSDNNSDDFQFQFLLEVTDKHVQLRRFFDKKEERLQGGPVFCDFTSGVITHKRKFGYSPRDPMIRAVTLKNIPRTETRVVDATGGLGRDSFILASFGFKITMVERDPVVFSLLEDGVARGLKQQKDPEVAEILKNVKLVNQDAKEYLASLPESERPDVVFMDPMYPKKRLDAVTKSIPKKELKTLRAFLGSDRDSEELLKVAKQVAKYKVVFKRPKYVQPTPDVTYAQQSKETRFDVYTISSSSPNPNPAAAAAATDAVAAQSPPSPSQPSISQQQGEQ